jgi:hypothetical protein
MHKTLSDINEHVSAQGSWLPGHQSESCAFKKYWKAGNDEADRRANASNLTTVTLLPAESPAAVVQCLEPISAHDVVHHLSEVSAVLRQRSNYSLNLISLLSDALLATHATSACRVHRSTGACHLHKSTGARHHRIGRSSAQAGHPGSNSTTGLATVAASGGAEPTTSCWSPAPALLNEGKPCCSDTSF